MLNRIILYVILSIVALILLIFIMDVARRIHMARRYVRLDAARKDSEEAARSYIGGKSTLSLLKKEPHSIEWEAVEKLLFSALEAGEDAAKKAEAAFEGLGYIEEYLKKLEKGRRWQRALATEKLGRIRSKRAVPALIRAMEEGPGDLRNAAIDALGAIGEESAIGPLTEGLKKSAATLKQPGGSSIRIIKSALISFGGRAVPYLVKEAKNSNWRIRAQSLDILAAIADASAEDVFIDALDDPESDVRAKAAKGLGSMGSTVAPRHLCRLIRDPSWVVRLYAVRSLGNIAPRTALEEIRRALNDSNWQVRRAAAEVLGKMGTLALPLLSDIVIHSTDRYAREQAIEEMERSGLMDVVVRGLLEEEKSKISEDILSAMAQKGIITPLLRALEEGSPEIRKKIEELLSKRDGDG